MPKPILRPQNRDYLSWIDRQLIETSWFMLAAITVLFFAPVLIFSIVGLVAARDPVARKKAKILFGICMGYAALVGLLIFYAIQSEGA